jgi:bifunctional non-homologous end joining protein LigD
VSEPFTIRFPAPLPAERRGEHWWAEADGHEVRLSNLAKPYWPPEAGGFTKGDLLAYYVNAGPTIVPYLEGRPLTLKRMPNGIAGKAFYQKDMPEGVPDWVTRCKVDTEDGRVDDMLVADSVAALLFVANLGCIETHPYHSRCPTPDEPDYLVVDLDPMPPAGFAEAIALAGHVRVLLEGLGLSGYPKTSGATGVQIYVPIAAGYTYDDTRAVAGRMGAMLVDADPERVTMDWSVKRRGGKVFFDHRMNRKAASLAGVYSVRPEPGAPVSTPLTWDEVRAGDVRPGQFTMATIFERLAAVGDLFGGVLTERQDLGAVMARLGISPAHGEGTGGRMRTAPPTH